MKKGFTLVEMLGIITVLAAVLFVTFPSINNSLKQTKESYINNSMNNLKLSLETYIQLNENKYPELKTIGGRISIKISELYDNNVLKGDQYGVGPNDYATVKVNDDNTLSYYFKGKEI